MVVVAIGASEPDDERGRPTGSARLRRRRQANVPGGREVVRKVKLTPTQDEALVARAAAAGVSVARLLVESALRSRPEAGRVETISGLFALTQHVARIGNNLNQIARIANSARHVPIETADVLDGVRTMLSRLDELVDEAQGTPPALDDAEGSGP